MVMTPGEGERAAENWRAASLPTVVSTLCNAASDEPRGRPLIVAVDGRSGEGKTTLVQGLLQAVPASAVLHTGDLAWHHSFFGWSDMLRLEVLEPLRLGLPGDFRPPAWDIHGRPGAISVPAGLEVVWVEGTGSSRRSLSALIDASIWVQSDKAEAERRLFTRDRPGEEQLRQEWEREEVAFLLDDEPWSRATLIVAGTPVLSEIPSGHVAVAALPRTDPP
jgi:hypothetical protein